MMPSGFRCASVLLIAAWLGGCASTPVSGPTKRTPEEVRAQLETLVPTRVPDHKGWAADIEAAFRHLDVLTSTDNLCAVLAVIEQETGYRANPEVPGLPAMARLEIERRAATLKIPKFAVAAALELPAGNGQTYAEQLARLKTEKDMSDLFDAMIARVPLGERLFADKNPVRTGGSMQVSILFSEQFAAEHGYPYDRGERRIRDEVFTRRGGVYFGTAHLLKYENSYTRHIFRYADFNAGWYTSRNAAFQNALSRISGVALVPDGDLTIPDRGLFASNAVGETERVLLSMADRLGLTESRIKADLELQDLFVFEDTPTWNAVFRLADAKAKTLVPRAALPKITLKSPKITRKLTTEWFANRVQTRYQDCINRAYATSPKD